VKFPFTSVFNIVNFDKAFRTEIAIKIEFMNNPIKPLVVFIIALAGLVYGFTIIYAVVLTLMKSKSALDPLLVSAATVIGGVLSTNLGAVLGVTFTPPQLRTPQSSPPFLGLRPSLQNAATSPNTTAPDASQKFQIIACWVYVGGLVIAFVGWVIAKIQSIPDAQIQGLLPEMVKILLGVMVGALTVALGRQQ
jgi:hypothetical protein